MLVKLNNKLVEINKSNFLNNNDYFNNILKIKFNKSVDKIQNDNFKIDFFLKKCKP